MQSAEMLVANAHRAPFRQLPLDLEAALLGVAVLDVRVLGEVERTVVSEWSAETGAILRLGGGKLAVGKRIGGVETLIAHVTIQVGMQRIRTALDDHVDVTAQGASQLGVASRGDDLKLLHYVEAVEYSAEP